MNRSGGGRGTVLCLLVSLLRLKGLSKDTLHLMRMWGVRISWKLTWIYRKVNSLRMIDIWTNQRIVSCLRGKLRKYLVMKLLKICSSLNSLNTGLSSRILIIRIIIVLVWWRVTRNLRVRDNLYSNNSWIFLSSRTRWL